MTQASFEYNGATITVQARTGRVEVLKGHLRRISGAWDKDVDELRSTELLTAMRYLSQTVKVDGALGFHVPLDTPTRNNLESFTDALMESPAILLDAWEKAIGEADKSANEPDLLPPAELDPAKKKTPTQKPSAKPNATGS